MADENKAIALDWIVNFITSVFLCISYSMTIDMLITLDNGDLDVLGFVRGSAVFLVPCALEGINIIIKKTGKKASIDKMEFAISILSILIGGYLVYAALANKNFIPVEIIKIMLTIYPLKYIINFFDGLIQLAKIR